MPETPRPEARPTAGPPRDWLRLSEESPRTRPLGVARARVVPEPPPPELPGYELLGVLGRGGMGIVYKARQRQLGRVVALKMLLAGQHSDSVSLARLRREGEAIARLQHPNIVQIFEVGDYQGLPYLVLEYVAGGGLDDWLRHHIPSPQDAAALVETLARAVHVAHQAGLVHRDLKPANVLLQRLTPEGEPDEDTSPDAGRATGRSRSSSATVVGSLADAVPKITDFGLAKWLEDPAGGLTRSGVTLGTPAYMAPEQLGARHAPVGPAADVYSLGVILYEMLAGRPPFQPGEAADVFFQVSLRDPITPRYWRPHLPVDLNNVCLKCLRKDPQQRYQSALELADDLRRFLANKPVQARPLGPLTRGVRWCRRHPLTAALFALVVLLLATVAGVAAAGYVSVRAEQAATEAARQDALRQADAADAARKDALRLAAVAEAARKQALQDQADAKAALEREKQWRVRLQHALEATAPALLDDLLEEEPDLTPRHKALLQQVADVFKGYAEEARRDDPPSPDVAVAFGHLGRLYQRLGKAPEAEAAFGEAVRLFDAGAAPAPRRAAGRYRVELGRLLAGQKDRQEEALSSLERGRADLWRLLEEAPAGADNREAFAAASVALADVLRDRDRLAEAETALCQAVMVDASLVRDRPREPRDRRALATALHDLSQVEDALGRHDQWEACLHVALGALESLPPSVAPPTDYEQPLATMHNDLAVYYIRQQRLGEAEGHLRQAVRQGELLVGRFPRARAHAVLLGGSYCNLGGVLGSKDARAGLEWYGKALDVLLPVYHGAPDYPKAKEFLGNTYANRARADEALGRPAAAALDWEAVVRLRTGPDRVRARANQAADQLTAGDAAGATATVVAAEREGGAAAPDVWFALAAVQAKAAAAYPEGSAEREAALARAVRLLRPAAAGGFFADKGPDALLKNDAFELLRNRDDFRRIMESLMK